MDGFRTVIAGIRQVVESARPPGEATQRITLDHELRRLIRVVCGRQWPNVKVVYDLQCPSALAHIGSLSLKIAVEKIVRNAMGAMKGQGTLTIATRQVGEMLHITIHDTGPGLPNYARADFLKRPITRPVGAPVTGTGRGVLIARFVMLTHGGTLTLDFSDEQQGTQIRLTRQSLAATNPNWWSRRLTIRRIGHDGGHDVCKTNPADR